MVNLVQRNNQELNPKETEKARRIKAREEALLKLNEEENDASEFGEEESYEEDEGEEEIEYEQENYTNVQNRLLSHRNKTKRKVDPVYEKARLKRREQRIQKFKEQTRWLPNSAF